MCATTSTEMIEIPDDIEEAFERLYGLGWTDGLPVIPPSLKRVQRMLASVRQDPADVVARVPPRDAAATVEKIAINAVMAGCAPDYLPVLIGAVKAMTAPEFNLRTIQGTTGPMAPLALINGPVRKTLDVNCTGNALGPGRRFNATLGRAIRLILINIGGGIPGAGDMAQLGQPGKYTMALGEDEEGNPWEPLHVERGFAIGDSTVTMIPVDFMNKVAPVGCVKGENILRVIADSMSVMGHTNVLLGGGIGLVLLPSGFAQRLAAQGYTKEQVKDYLFEASQIPLSRFPDERILPQQTLRIVGDRACPFKAPEDILVVVAGSPEPYTVTYCGGWESRPVTKKVVTDDSSR